MKLDFANFLTTISATGFGAWGAYLFSLKQEEKRQKEAEKSQLVQLFYDLNILSKYIYRYGTNVKKLAQSICNGTSPYNTPIAMDSETIDIEKLGFITLKSNKMYEILSHTRMEILTIFEQGIIYNETVIKKKKDTIAQLVTICILFPKLVTMIYVCLININSMLIKYYNVDNLIKDNILNTMTEMLEVIENAKKEYNNVINNEELICFYTGKPYTQEQKDGEREDLEYIEYVLNDWILDFELKNSGLKSILNYIKKIILKNRKMEEEHDL